MPVSETGVGPTTDTNRPISLGQWAELTISSRMIHGDARTVYDKRHKTGIVFRRLALRVRSAGRFGVKAGNSLATIPHLELLENMVDVLVDCRDGYSKPGRDLAVGPTPAQFD
jgi:hypothetical protein